jgi:hypothetical protein
MEKRLTATMYLLEDDLKRFDAIKIKRIENHKQASITSILREALQLLYDKEVKNSSK